MSIEEIRERARRALSKSSPYGIDVSYSDYELGEIHPVRDLSMDELPASVRSQAERVGMDVSERAASGTYFQIDHEVMRRYVTERLRRHGVIVMSTLEALQKFDWAREYYWKALPVDLDKYTALAEVYLRHGYFIYVPPGVKVREPIQACLLVSKSRIAQPMHNIVIADEGSELYLVTGCTAMVDEGLHVGVTEFYVKRNAKIVFTMIHGWTRGFHARPRSAAIVEDGGEFVSYYINLHPVKSLQLFPTVYLHSNARAYLTSIILARGDANIDAGLRIVLRGEHSRGEAISRGVIRDRASLFMRGELISEASRTKGHLECKGLMLSDEATTIAVPVLRSTSKDAELTHEAAIGRISEDELIYLMMRGFDEEEATSIIVRGFTDVGLEHVPPQLRRPIESVLEVLARYARM